MVKQGRNAKSNTIPKNAELIDYKYATGFETLIGQLYLSGNDERLSQINASQRYINNKIQNYQKILAIGENRNLNTRKK